MGLKTTFANVFQPHLRALEKWFIMFSFRRSRNTSGVTLTRKLYNKHSSFLHFMLRKLLLAFSGICFPFERKSEATKIARSLFEKRNIWMAQHHQRSVERGLGRHYTFPLNHLPFFFRFVTPHLTREGSENSWGSQWKKYTCKENVSSRWLLFIVRIAFNGIGLTRVHSKIVDFKRGTSQTCVLFLLLSSIPTYY